MAFDSSRVTSRRTYAVGGLSIEIRQFFVNDNDDDIILRRSK